MTRLRTGRKLDAVDRKIAALEEQRRTLETRALGGELNDAGRRERYFSIPDLALRRKAIGIERALHELRQQQQVATVDYWASVAATTRSKLADLQSESPTSAWRRGIWWDVLTIFWILVGAGWLAARIPGAVGGAVAAAVWGWFIVRGRERTRLTYIRQGEDMLRSSERELQQAQRHAARPSPSPALFSASEAETGTPDEQAGSTAEHSA